MGGELRLEVLGAGPACGVRLHTGFDEGAQFVGEAGQVGAFAQEHEDGFHRVGAVEGGVSGGGEDEGGAEGEDVAGTGDAAGVAGLFRRHVRGGADGDVGHGEAGVGDTRGDAEVDHTGTVLDDEDVGRLEVAVDQARAVDGLEGLGDAGRQPADRLGRQGPALVHYFLEGGGGHVGGGEPGHGGAWIGVHDGRGVEAGDRPCRFHLAGEADAEQLVFGELGTHRLDRHAPAGCRPCEIDQPHAAGSEPSQHLEGADPPRVVLRQLLHFACHLPVGAM